MNKGRNCYLRSRWNACQTRSVCPTLWILSPPSPQLSVNTNLGLVAFTLAQKPSSPWVANTVHASVFPTLSWSREYRERMQNDSMLWRYQCTCTLVTPSHRGILPFGSRFDHVRMNCWVPSLMGPGSSTGIQIEQVT